MNFGGFSEFNYRVMADKANVSSGFVQNPRFGTIVVIWTHVKPISADTSVDVQSKMHHLFVEVVSRHTKVIN